jgi:hypothetical protein
MSDRYLSIYLNDHLAGAVLARRIAERALVQNADHPVRDALRVLSREIEEDREALIRVMDLVGARRDPVKPRAMWAAERVGRVFKFNGHLMKYSPLSRYEELELLSLGVEGKLLMWRTLESLAQTDERLQGFDFATLIKRARAQREELERYRLDSASEAFRVLSV